MKPLALLSIALVLCSAACSGVYYNAMEKIGFAKRDILVDRVGEARESQEDAKEQFSNALEQFLAITQVKPGDLQSRYDKLDREFKRSEAAAAEVHSRIAAIEDVSEALFREWQKELKQYSDRSLRQQSERQLDQTRAHYDELMRTMKAAAKRMDPILGKFRDQVLFLKHNLNAQAIAGLTATARGLEADISKLIAEMETSIREADAFIKAMKTQP